MERTAAARARGVSKRFGRVVALDGVDLDVPAGQVHGLVGPNGAGKTTLLGLLLGLAVPDGGTLEILGKPVFRSLASIPGPVDLVDVFRRPKDIPQHVDDIITKRPKAVWFQLGIRNDEAAERLAREGIDVVQDHCLMVEARRIGR